MFAIVSGAYDCSIRHIPQLNIMLFICKVDCRVHARSRLGLPLAPLLRHRVLGGFGSSRFILFRLLGGGYRGLISSARLITAGRGGCQDEAATQLDDCRH
jgi:hypothetical protein